MMVLRVAESSHFCEASHAIHEKKQVDALTNIGKNLDGISRIVPKILPSRLKHSVAMGVHHPYAQRCDRTWHCGSIKDW